jgi:hypothetical protein
LARRVLAVSKTPLAGEQTRHDSMRETSARETRGIITGNRAVIEGEMVVCETGVLRVVRESGKSLAERRKGRAGLLTYGRKASPAGCHEQPAQRRLHLAASGGTPTQDSSALARRSLVNYTSFGQSGAISLGKFTWRLGMVQSPVERYRASSRCLKIALYHVINAI